MILLGRPIIQMKTPKVRKMKTLAQSGEWLNPVLNTTVAVKNFSPKM